MPKKFIMVGGVHGIGKSTLCQVLALDIKAAYLSTGVLVPYYVTRITKNWDYKSSSEKKEIISIVENKIAESIKSCLKEYDNVLLDGHYSIKTEGGYTPGIHEKNLETLFEIPFEGYICLIKGTEEQLVNRLKFDPRDKQHRITKIEEIREHFKKEQEYFEKACQFFEKRIKIHREEIFACDWDLGKMLSQIKGAI
jgi:adenylate kinase